MTIPSCLRSIPGTARQRLAVATIACTLTGTVMTSLAAPITMQDGTTAATPVPPSTCKVVDARASAAISETPVDTVATPIVPPGTPQASPGASPQASPVIDLATPMVSPAASPVAVEPSPEASDPLTTDLTAVTTSLFGCLNERDFDTYARLTSDTWRGAMFGSSERLSPADFADIAATLPDVDTRLISVTHAVRKDADTAHATVTWVSAYQQLIANWVFQLKDIDGVQTWIPYSQSPLPIETPEGSYVIDVTMQDAGYTLDPDSANGPEVTLDITNPTRADHEVLIVRLDDGVQPEALLQGGSFPEGVEYIGQATILAGDRGSILLTHLPTGTYTIVDLLPDATGNPNLAAGMKATFTVGN